MEQILVIFAMVIVAGFIGYKAYQMTKTKPSTPNTGSGGTGSSTPSEGDRPTKDFPEELKQE